MHGIKRRRKTLTDDKIQGEMLTSAEQLLTFDMKHGHERII